MAFYDQTSRAKLLSVAAVGFLWMVLWLGTACGSEVATSLVSDLNVRSGPDLRNAVLFRLARHTQVRVLKHMGDWLKIDHNGRRGYILGRADFVSLETIDEHPQDQLVPATDASGQAQLADLHQEAETLKQRLQTSRNQLDETSRRERHILDEINAADRALDLARSQVREARTELDALQAKVTAIERRYDSLESDIREGESYAKQRLVAVYKLNWLGRIQLLATARSFYDFINRKSALERILAQDEALLDKLRSDQIALASLLERLNTSKVEKRAARIALNRRIAQLADGQAKRSALLESVRSRKDLQRAALAALKQTARELDGVIGSLEPVSPPAKAKVPSTAPAGKAWFGASKGLLGWPVRGKIVSFFGPYRDEKTNVVNFQSGINIQAERGEPVRAVSGGYTIYANWFKGFGNMMIIDHGDHYYTVYAHLEEVFKVKGDRVEKGEVIATVGDSGSMMGPALHFEVRHHGKPVDPLQWINKG